MFSLIRKIFFVFLILGLVIFLIFNQTKSFEYEQEVLGTVCRLQIKASPFKAEKISKEIISLWQDIQNKTNILIPESEISVLNTQKKLQVSERLYEMIASGYVLSEKTGGYFDITIGTLTTRLFKGEKLSNHQIKILLSKVNYQKVNMDNKSKTVWITDPALKLDVWGLSKGYAADETLKILKKYHVKEALIDLGGQITVLGPDKKIVLEDPDNPGHLWQEIVLKNGQTLSTSNQVWQGKHIFVPGGKPRKQNYSSVSVIANQGIIADTFSTAIFVSGDRSLKKVFKDIQVYVR